VKNNILALSLRKRFICYFHNIFHWTNTTIIHQNLNNQYWIVNFVINKLIIIVIIIILIIILIIIIIIVVVIVVILVVIVVIVIVIVVIVVIELVIFNTTTTTTTAILCSCIIRNLRRIHCLTNFSVTGKNSQLHVQWVWTSVGNARNIFHRRNFHVETFFDAPHRSNISRFL